MHNLLETLLVSSKEAFTFLMCVFLKSDSIGLILKLAPLLP